MIDEIFESAIARLKRTLKKRQEAIDYFHRHLEPVTFSDRHHSMEISVSGLSTAESTKPRR